MSANDRDTTNDAEVSLQEEAKGYFATTRRLSVSLLFSLPLLAVYELGALLTRSDTSAAAVIVKTPISWLQRHPAQLFGADLALIINSLLIVAVIVAVIHARRLGALQLDSFAGMFGESLVYAMLLGPLALEIGRAHV